MNRLFCNLPIQFRILIPFIKLAEILASSSGYALEAPEGLAVGGGFKDWFIQNFSRPAFTIEIGRGKNPLPPETLPEIYSRLREMMMFALML